MINLSQLLQEKKRGHYTMGGYFPTGSVIKKPALEKDHGYIISIDLKPVLTSQPPAKKANSVLELKSLQSLF